MRNSIPLQTLTMVLAGAVAASRFVSTALAQAGAGDYTYGVARTAGEIGEAIPVDTIGTAVIETGGAILAGAQVQADASGRAITIGAGVAVGRLAPGESSSAAGQFVEIILITN